MTKARPAAAAASAGTDAVSLFLREIVRRSGHEIRNALNGVAVNVEVVRARVGRGSGSTDIDAFAARASEQVGVASAISDGLLSLLGNVYSAQSESLLRSTGSGARSQLELMIYGDKADAFVSAIKPLADGIGLDVSRGDRSVILTISPQDRSHSKE